MRRFLLLLLVCCCACVAQARRFHGGTTTSPLTITTASLSGAIVGSAWTPGALTTSGQVGAVSCFTVSATPDDQGWMYLSPAGVPGGIPQNVETETVTYECATATQVSAPATFTFNTTASGSLAVVSSTSLSGCADNGYCAYQTILSGGKPPYSVNVTSSQPWSQTVDNWIEGTPTATGAVSLVSETISDSVGATVTYAPTVTVGTALTMAGIDPIAGVIRLPQGSVDAYYGVQLNWYGGTGSSDACSTTSTLPSGITLSSGCLLSGTTTQIGAWAVAVKITDSGGNTTDTAWLAIGNSGVVSRPAYNSSTANGFFQLNGHLYDPNGVPFNIAGVDRAHYNSDTWASNTNGALSGANAVRFFSSSYDSTTCTTYGVCTVPTVVADHIDNGELPIITVASVYTFMGAGSITGSTLTLTGTTYGTLAIGDSVWPAWATGLPYGATITGGSGTTWTLSAAATGTTSGAFAASTRATSGDTSLGDLALIGDYWAALESTWAPYMNEIAINLANEFGGAVGSPNSVSDWQTAYESVVSQLRTAGYTCPIIIDTLSYGQDFTAYAGGEAAAIEAADPLHNVVFSNHLYGTTNLLGQISGITKGTNAVITINSAATANPFAGFVSNKVYVTGVSGMTQINGQTVTWTAAGGSSGAWTLTTNLDTSSYGAWTSGGTAYDNYSYWQRLSTLGGYIAAGLPIIIGEFGLPPLNNVTAGLEQFTTAANSWGVPSINWAWDDNNGGGGTSTWAPDLAGEAGWSATLAGPGTYALDAPSGLTQGGMTVVLNPRSGTSLTGIPASVFH